MENNTATWYWGEQEGNIVKYFNYEEVLIFTILNKSFIVIAVLKLCIPRHYPALVVLAMNSLAVIKKNVFRVYIKNNNNLKKKKNVFHSGISCYIFS